MLLQNVVDSQALNSSAINKGLLQRVTQYQLQLWPWTYQETHYGFL